MQVIFVRHGKAVDRGTMPNFDRHLTEQGIAEWKEYSKDLVEYIKSKNIKYKICSSELVRAVQTAEILASGLGTDEITYYSFLANGDLDTLLYLTESLAADNITPILVGHEPFISCWLHSLTGNYYHVKKGSYCVLDLESKQILEAQRITRI